MKSLTLLSSIVLCLAAAPAFASTTTCTGDMSGLISGPLTVSQGDTCRLIGAEVTGPVTVNGILHSYGTRFDAKVTVNGGTIVIANGNGEGSSLNGGLSITGSGGNNQIGCPNISNVIHGQLSFTNNTGNLYVCQLTIDAPVTISGNIRQNNDSSGWYVADINNVTAPKFTCQGNVSAGSADGAGVKGTGDTGNKTGCPALN
jgi:hypothetical protein